MPALKLLRYKGDPTALPYRPLAGHGRGRKDAVRTALEQAVKWLETPDEGDPELENIDSLNWQQCLEVDMLRREVQALLQAGEGAK